jgi:ABC-type nitrate/sulfonate/bicarbonate transport system ATPase subunit
MIEAPLQASRGSGPGRPTDSEPPPAMVELDRVSRTFRPARRPEVPALAEVSLRASAGETVAVVGPSGCGKSTLLELICGLQRPDSGTVHSAPAALMPQRDLLLPWASALDNAALALRAAGVGRDAAREQAAPWLERFGLAEFARARPAELSGGMRQRVSFLRSLLAGKPVLALDEPFGSLDAITRAEMQSWLDRVLQTEPRTVVLVTHDVEEAVMLGDRVIVLSGRPGRVLESVEVTVARPRRRADAAIVALREQVLGALGVSG